MGLLCPIRMKFGMWVPVVLDEWSTTIWPSPCSKVKVKWPSKLRKVPFSDSISSAFSQPISSLITDSDTRGKYLNLITPHFWISSPVTGHVTLNFVRPMSVRTSTQSFSDRNEIWYVGSTRRVVHNDMTLTLLPDQGQMTVKFAKSAIFRLYRLHHFSTDLKFNCKTDSDTRGQYINLFGPNFCISFPVTGHVTLKFGRPTSVRTSTQSFSDPNEIWWGGRGCVPQAIAISCLFLWWSNNEMRLCVIGGLKV